MVACRLVKMEDFQRAISLLVDAVDTVLSIAAKGSSQEEGQTEQLIMSYEDPWAVLQSATEHFVSIRPVTAGTSLRPVTAGTSLRPVTASASALRPVTAGTSLSASVDEHKQLFQYTSLQKEKQAGGVCHEPRGSRQGRGRRNAYASETVSRD